MDIFVLLLLMLFFNKVFLNTAWPKRVISNYLLEKQHTGNKEVFFLYWIVAVTEVKYLATWIINALLPQKFRGLLIEKPHTNNTKVFVSFIEFHVRISYKEKN